MLNTCGVNRESPGRTGNDRRGTGNNRNIQTPAELRQRPGCRLWWPGGAPVNAGRVPVKLRYIGKPAHCQDATGIHRGSAWELRATTVLNRGVDVALPGCDSGIAPLSGGGVTVYRDSAGTLPAFTGARLGHYRRQPWLLRGFTGLNRS
ncbi:hypothetical protein DPMN_077333 [Dreissena polymorpha]|uniref:Uncharacterized protein n=1 Tax=Dreissena polymorpha TaxID=45954 RepID=A0A9D4BN70_DREPO|nr:hypothetical protein DPMN_077333 [Dreissena polymorpha]